VLRFDTGRVGVDARAELVDCFDHGASWAVVWALTAPAAASQAA
jgi:hypothetical protein